MYLTLRGVSHCNGTDYKPTSAGKLLLILRSKVAANESAYEKARYGKSPSAIPFRSVSWIRAKMTWEEGVTTIT